MERSHLHVDVSDDFHALVHLLIRHGIDYDTKPWPPEFPMIDPQESVSKLLGSMELAVKTSTGRAIGFVLDADSPLAGRWQEVSCRLANVGVVLPPVPPREGFVGESVDYHARVGVWLMPDNHHDGKLEDFLRDLIAECNPIISHAEQATDVAKNLGARFRDVDQIKATIHAWLAWQTEPGLPFGTAIRARYFGHNSQAAVAFVDWFRRLYGLQPQSDI
jgi:hypothetical protein